MTPAPTFICSICGEASNDICVFCTKDACGNHLCEKCRRCSDCCECEIRLDEHPEAPAVHAPAAEPLIPEPSTAEAEAMPPLAALPETVPEAPPATVEPDQHPH